MAHNDKVEIWLIEDKDDRCDSATGEAVRIFNFVSAEGDYADEVVRVRDGKEATLEQLVGLCDRDAEDVNAHDLCGAHRLLGAVLYRRLGRAKATEVMLEIAERRGLHGMSGICGLQDSFHDLGVGDNGHDWEGTYGE